MGQLSESQSAAPPGQQPQAALVRIPVAISARHVHLTESVIEALFCDEYHLHVLAGLAQPGQFAAEECVTLIGPHGRIPHVRIVGPPRAENQVELSRTDALTLGMRVPVRESGDLAGTPGILVEGPRGSVKLDSGVICALRHVHMCPQEAARLGFKDQDRIELAAENDDRRMLFRDVVVRVSPAYRLEMHLDTDEGNAAGLQSGDFVVLRR
jgi:propanediol utilization protein